MGDKPTTPAMGPLLIRLTAVYGIELLQKEPRVSEGVVKVIYIAKNGD
jgi:hypothetical protein